MDFGKKNTYVKKKTVIKRSVCIVENQFFGLFSILVVTM